MELTFCQQHQLNQCETRIFERCQYGYAEILVTLVCNRFGKMLKSKYKHSEDRKRER